MSRSYKKHPGAGEKKQKWAKREANRKVRRSLKSDIELDIPHREFKKYYQSWNIFDYGWWLAPSFEKFCEDQWRVYDKYGENNFGWTKQHWGACHRPTKKELRNLYDSWFRRK